MTCRSEEPKGQKGNRGVFLEGCLCCLLTAMWACPTYTGDLIQGLHITEREEGEREKKREMEREKQEKERKRKGERGREETERKTCTVREMQKERERNKEKGGRMRRAVVSVSLHLFTHDDVAVDVFIVSGFAIVCAEAVSMICGSLICRKMTPVFHVKLMVVQDSLLCCCTLD